MFLLLSKEKIAFYEMKFFLKIKEKTVTVKIDL